MWRVRETRNFLGRDMLPPPRGATWTAKMYFADERQQSGALALGSSDLIAHAIGRIPWMRPLFMFTRRSPSVLRSAHSQIEQPSS